MAKYHAKEMWIEHEPHAWCGLKGPHKACASNPDADTVKVELRNDPGPSFMTINGKPSGWVHWLFNRRRQRI